MEGDAGAGVRRWEQAGKRGEEQSAELAQAARVPGVDLEVRREPSGGVEALNAVEGILLVEEAKKKRCRALAVDLRRRGGGHCEGQVKLSAWMCSWVVSGAWVGRSTARTSACNDGNVMNGYTAAH